MKILAHRGIWYTEQEKNTLTAMERAFSSGYGIETDIRDLNQKIVISHNPADESCPSLDELLSIWEKYDNRPLLALNIKADGLYLYLDEIFKRHRLAAKDYFLFDSSVPEQYVYLKRGYNIFTRSSEFEEKISFWENSTGIWLDQFTECGHIARILPELLDSGKMVSVVSPELHKRDNSEIWKLLYRHKDRDNLLLCTDIPEKAEEYFK